MDLEEIESPLHSCSMLSQLRSLREDGTLCDVVIQVEEEKFQAHRLVLAGCSDYFRAMFSHNMVETQQDTICLPSMKKAVFKDLLNYAYSGKLYLNMNNIPDILEGVVFLQVTSAIALCLQYLKQKINFENGDEFVAITEDFGLTDLREHYKEYVLENFLEFCKTKKFLELDATMLANYLADDRLRTTTEARLLKCALKWYNYDKKGRYHEVHEVMEKIRYTIDGWPTIEYAYAKEPFISNKKCRDLLDFSSRYMQNAIRKYLQQDHRTRVRFPKKTLVQFGGMLGNTGDAAFESFLGQTGCGHNHFYHRDDERWVSLGVVGLTDLWTHCPVVEVNGFGILCGGYSYLGTMGQQAQNKVFSREVRLFTPGGFALWDLSHMHERRAHHVVVRVQEFLYAIGGKDQHHIHSTVEMYDMHKERWYFIQPLSHPVYDHAGTAMQDQVFISGGIVGGAASSQVLSYCPKKGKWQQRASLLQARVGHTMTSVQDKIIVCGGKPQVSEPRCLSSVEVYHADTNQWTYTTPMRYDCWAMSAVVLDNKLLVVGGENSVGDIQSRIQEYDPCSGAWGSFGHLPYPMKNLGCCTLTIKWTDSDKDELDSIVDAPYCMDRSANWSDSDNDFEEMCDDFEDEIWHGSSRRGNGRNAESLV